MVTQSGFKTAVYDLCDACIELLYDMLCRSVMHTLTCLWSEAALMIAAWQHVDLPNESAC
jgi:hypothetical protein